MFHSDPGGRKIGGTAPVQIIRIEKIAIFARGPVCGGLNIELAGRNGGANDTDKLLSEFVKHSTTGIADCENAGIVSGDGVVREPVPKYGIGMVSARFRNMRKSPAIALI